MTTLLKDEYFVLFLNTNLKSEWDLINNSYRFNLGCRGLFVIACIGDLFGDNGEVSPSSCKFSSSSLIDGNVKDGTPFTSDSC